MTSDFLIGRRRALLGEINGNTAVVLAGAVAVQSAGDAAYPFVQDANFLYLTGINEAGWRLIIKSDGEAILIAPDISEVHRIFDGGLSNQEAMKMSGVNRVVVTKEGEVLIEKLFVDGGLIGVIGPDPHEEYYSFTVNPGPQKLYENVKKKAKSYQDIRPALAKMRGIKSAEEVESIQRAIDSTTSAFKKVKDRLSAASFEYNIDAEFTYAFRNVGATHAYEPIVAADANACTLHYVKNDAALPENGLVLMDVGARVNGYCADITRTYAIGTPTDRQIAVHASVEKAHHEIIALLQPGLSVKTYHEKVDEIMKSAIDSLGLLKKPEDYRKYFPHAISHGLGLDVHDPLGAPKEFKPGMVLTVEPGIYIPEEGIGVRIEDDILITDTGHENLSGALSTAL